VDKLYFSYSTSPFQYATFSDPTTYIAPPFNHLRWYHRNRENLIWWGFQDRLLPYMFKLFPCFGATAWILCTLIFRLAEGQITAISSTMIGPHRHTVGAGLDRRSCCLIWATTTLPSPIDHHQSSFYNLWLAHERHQQCPSRLLSSSHAATSSECSPCPLRDLEECQSMLMFNYWLIYFWVYVVGSGQEESGRVNDEQ
jgi:hypothetical protein